MVFKSKTDFMTLTYSRQLWTMAQKYDDVVDFTLGDPDITTPQSICEAAYKAIQEGKTHYAPNAGIPMLRQAVCDFVNRSKKTNYTSDQCVITVGAVGAIYLSFMALLNPGDEVIIISPYWSQYKNIVKLLGGIPIILDKLSSNFDPDIELLKKLVGKKTKAIIINSPNNPSGHIYSKEVLTSIANIAVDNDLYVFADEVYETLVYEKDFCSMISCCPKNNLLLFNGCSKAFAMTGWRVGYLLGPSDFVKSVIKLQQNVVTCVPTMSQYAALEAFTNAEKYIPEIVSIFKNRRNVLVSEMQEVPRLKLTKPEGTFYAFIDISDTGMTSRDFAFSLIDKKHVALVPGIAYGENFDHYVRLSFTQNEAKIKEGVNRIKDYVLSI